MLVLDPEVHRLARDRAAIRNGCDTGFARCMTDVQASDAGELMWRSYDHAHERALTIEIGHVRCGAAHLDGTIDSKLLRSDEFQARDRKRAELPGRSPARPCARKSSAA